MITSHRARSTHIEYTRLPGVHALSFCECISLLGGVHRTVISRFSSSTDVVCQLCRVLRMGCRPTEVLREAMAQFPSITAFCGPRTSIFYRKHAYFEGESPGASTSLCDSGFSPVQETAVSTCPPRGNLVDGLPRAPT